jgi:hypothetical protein
VGRSGRKKCHVSSAFVANGGTLAAPAPSAGRSKKSILAVLQVNRKYPK